MLTSVAFPLFPCRYSSLITVSSDSSAVARRHGGCDNDDGENNGDNDDNDDDDDDDDVNGYVEEDGQFELPRLTGWRLDHAEEARY